MIEFKIKQKTRKGNIIFDILAYFQGAWRPVCTNNRSLTDCMEFFVTAKSITWNSDNMSGFYCF